MAARFRADFHPTHQHNMSMFMNYWCLHVHTLFQNIDFGYSLEPAVLPCTHTVLSINSQHINISNDSSSDVVAVVAVVVHNVQTSSPLKPRGQSKQNFMWSILRKRELKMAARAILAKTLKKVSSLKRMDRFQVALGTPSHHSLYKS